LPPAVRRDGGDGSPRGHAFEKSQRYASSTRAPAWTSAFQGSAAMGYGRSDAC